MKIAVGTKNPAKLDAVREILQEYPHLVNAEIVGVEVSSNVADQPISLEEVTNGAANRARSARGSSDYGIGLEAGFMQVPNSKSGYMNVNACAVYDGQDTHLGLSSAFETPDQEVMRLVIEDGLKFNEAANRTGLDEDPEIAKKHGVVGTVTRGRVVRKEFVKQSLRMALVHIDR